MIEKVANSIQSRSTHVGVNNWEMRYRQQVYRIARDAGEDIEVRISRHRSGSYSVSVDGKGHAGIPRPGKAAEVAVDLISKALEQPND